MSISSSINDCNSNGNSLIRPGQCLVDDVYIKSAFSSTAICFFYLFLSPKIPFANESTTFIVFSLNVKCRVNCVNKVMLWQRMP